MQWFANLKTRSKLTAGFGLVSALLVVIVVSAWLSLQAMHDAERGISDAFSIRNNLSGQRAAMLGAVLAPSPAAAESRLKDAATYASESVEVLSRLKARYGGDAELRPLLEQLVAIRAESIRVREAEVIPLIRQQKKRRSGRPSSRSADGAE